MASFFLPYEQSLFHATCEGEGKELLICLHGFGEQAAGFSRLSRVLGKVYTLIAIDLPLHGQTSWKEERPFTTDDMLAVIRLVLARQQQESFSLLGYSMGGRVSLCILEYMAPQIRRLYLLAPDGLKNNPWHMFVTQTGIGNRLFKHVTYHPQLLFNLMRFLRRLKLLNESIYKFAYNSMNKLEKREQVYKVWTCMRKMMPDKKRCKQLLAQYNIQTLLIFGKYDRVIPPVLGIRFMDNTFKCKMLVLDKGHQLLSEELGESILDNYG
jgi:pimeloyl-ACP methyl ester carboxylesterase